MERNVRWLGVGGAVRATGLSLVAPYFALYLRHVLRLGFAEIGVLSAVVGIVPLTIVPFAGLITDRIGRRRLFVVALAGEGGSILVAALAMHLERLPLLLAAIASAQTDGTVAGPALSAYVADFTSAADRTLGFTWTRVGWNVGFTLGVVSGGTLIGFLGFVWVGVIAGAVLVGATGVIATVLEPSPYDLALAAGSAVRRPPARPASASLRALLADRPFVALCVAVALSELTVGQWGVTFPVYANAVLGLPYAVVGLGLALNGVLVVVAQAPTTRASIGHRHTSVLVLGIGLYAAGFLLLGAAGFLGIGVVVGFFLVVVVLTMGENVISIPTTTLPSNLAPPQEIGAYNGAFFAFMGAGQLLAPTVGGIALAYISNAPVLWSLLVVPAVPAMAWIGLGVAPRLRLGANRA